MNVILKINILLIFLLIQIATPSKIYCLDSLKHENPLVIGPDLDCNFEIIFNHLDSSSVYNCTFMGPEKFCNNSDSFVIEIHKCRKTRNFWPHFIGNPNNDGLFFLEGKVFKDNGYSYSGIFIRKVTDDIIDWVVTYYRHLNINGWELSIYYELIILPNFWTFQDLIQYCNFLHESIEVNYLEFY